ncbi:TIGR03032 family protein [Brumimicrobium salinarum]|uniref:TIGR03032 family protein n=1 Tax=Brumimicrobium salinarum TaxID=2058658 RepID=A0A2I0R4A9_9FLAO|nr:TIGR03032 family protein [Brumimicrobium salinarum]PKR81415.1 TIGR03032 family protein [Brumimicrobium salinarum]
MLKKYPINFDNEVAKFLFDKKISLIISTYQAGRVMILGSLDGLNLHQVPIGFKKPMGLSLEGNKLAIATLDNIFFFSNKEKVVNTLHLNEKQFDTVYLQRAKYSTSTLDIHDIGFGKGLLWGVNTLFSCISVFDINHSFTPKWKPPFITELVPEDRCHMNSMIMNEGMPTYVSMLSMTNEKEGWRKDIMNSGAIMKVPTGEVLIQNLALPHSLIDDGDFIYFLESGRGTLNKVNKRTGISELVYNFQRFVRGIKRIDDCFIVSFSALRKSSKTFGSITFDDNNNLAGFCIFDLKTNQIIGTLEYEADIEEIYDLAICDGFLKPVILNENQEEFNNVITFPRNVFWKKEKEK